MTIFVICVGSSLLSKATDVTISFSNIWFGTEADYTNCLRTAKPRTFIVETTNKISHYHKNNKNKIISIDH